MAIIWALLFGALLGWVSSMLARSDTNDRIVIDILVGALGAVGMALVLGNNSVFDSVLAAFLGTFVALAGISDASESWHVQWTSNAGVAPTRAKGHRLR